MTPNVKAFLDTIAFSELGSDLLTESDNGYNVIVGSRAGRMRLFRSYADHPRVPITMLIRGKVLTSTAAGRYQILARYFDVYKLQLGLPDFGHDAQDRIALQMIHECHAMADVEAGIFVAAASKCASRWASLPGANYGQHEQNIVDLIAAYRAAGGSIA